MNVDFLEVDCVRLEYLDVREAHGSILCKGNPETAFALGISQGLVSRDLVEHRVGRVAAQQLRSGQLNGPDQVQIARSGADDPVTRHHGGTVQHPDVHAQTHSW